MDRAPVISLRRRFFAVLFFPFILGVSLAATEPSAGPGNGSGGDRWVLRLLTRAFQENPPGDAAVTTEMTDPGRKIPAPTAERPVYYFAQPADCPPGEQGTVAAQPSPEATLVVALKRALAINHYLPAEPGHPAALRVFFMRPARNAPDSFYDGVVSGYDYPASLRGERILLWRSRMTMDFRGILVLKELLGSGWSGGD